jgi:hypothetical protein
MSNQAYANSGDPYWLSTRGVNNVSFDKLAAPPLAYLDKGILYELVDGILYYNGNPVQTGGTSTADFLATTGDAVNVKDADPPTEGQLLVASDATHAVWSSNVLGDNFFVIDNDSDLNRIAFLPAGSGETTTILATNATFDRTLTLPDATDTLVGKATTDVMTNKTIIAASNNVAANSLKTTGAVVDVAAAAPPSVGQVLRATSATTATWQTPAAGDVVGPASAVDDAIVRFDGITGKLVQNSAATIADATGVISAGGLVLPTTTSTVGQIQQSGSRLFHTYGPSINNLFAGVDSGNFTLTGDQNVMYGRDTGLALTNGASNTGMGVNSLKACTSGSVNTCYGNGAGASVTTGSNNTIVGGGSGLSIATGSNNTIVGAAAGNFVTGNSNVIVGDNAAGALTAGSNIIVGASAGSNFAGAETGNIIIGNNGTAADSATIRVGTAQTKAFIAGVFGITTVVADAIPVLVDSTGQLGTVSSSIKYKENVEEIDDLSYVVDQLRPVKFDYKDRVSRKKEIGLIAEEVEQIYPDMCIYDAKGELLTVDYARLSILLLAEMQKLKLQVALLAAQ